MITRYVRVWFAKWQHSYTYSNYTNRKKIAIRVILFEKINRINSHSVNHDLYSACFLNICNTRSPEWKKRCAIRQHCYSSKNCTTKSHNELFGLLGFIQHSDRPSIATIYYIWSSNVQSTLHYISVEQNEKFEQVDVSQFSAGFFCWRTMIKFQVFIWTWKETMRTH